MGIEKIGEKIASSGVYQAAGKKFNQFCDTVGPKINNALERHPKADKFLKMIEPTGANNAFLGMSSLMVGTVIVPRVLTAKKRNPDNKEATKDEIKEILFRDVQTVLIILFFLKAMNSGIAAITTKKKGLPLTNKPFDKLFESQTTGFKGIKDKAGELVSHPIKKAKTVGKNLLNMLHPTKGVIALTNEECTSKYSNFNSMEEIGKMLDEIDCNGGKSDKVFDSIINSLIKQQNIEIENANKASLAANGLGKDAIKEMQKGLEQLEELKQGKIEGFKQFIAAVNNGEISKDDFRVKVLLNFFKDGENALVEEALDLNATLRSIALFIEMTYLGFGLPALNEKRLEKKYLKDGAKLQQPEQKSDNYSKLINNNIKAQEIKLYHNFLK